MFFSRTVALRAAFFGSVVAARALVARDADIDIKFHKWCTLDCTDSEVGDPYGFGDMHCFTFDNSFVSFMYKDTILNQVLFYHNDYDNPTCKVIVYPLPKCLGNGWTPGQAGSHIGQCFNIPEELGDQMGEMSNGAWAQSAGVICGAGDKLAEEGFIKNGSIAYTTYQSWVDTYTVGF